MGLQEIKKRWEKAEEEMPKLVAPTRGEIQTHEDIRKLIAVAEAAKNFHAGVLEAFDDSEKFDVPMGIPILYEIELKNALAELEEE